MIFEAIKLSYLFSLVPFYPRTFFVPGIRLKIKLLIKKQSKKTIARTITNFNNAKIGITTKIIETPTNTGAWIRYIVYELANIVLDTFP